MKERTAPGSWGMCVRRFHSKAFFSGCHCVALTGYCTLYKHRCQISAEFKLLVHLYCESRWSFFVHSTTL